MDVNVNIELPLTRDEALYMYEDFQNRGNSSKNLSFIITWLKALPTTAEIKLTKNMITEELQIERIK